MRLTVKHDSNIPIHTLQSVLAKWVGPGKNKKSAIISRRLGHESRLEKGETTAGFGRWRQTGRIQQKTRFPSPQRGKGAGGEGVHHGPRKRPVDQLDSKVTGILATIIFLFPSIQFAHAAGKLSRFEESQPHMGTEARIVVYASNSEAAAAATRMAFERIRELDGILSDYQAESELNRLSHQSGGPPVKIGPDLFRVLSVAQNLAAKSHGAFDVTVGPVIRLWRRARRQRALPEADRLAAALDLTGFRWLTLDTKHQTAHLAKPGMLLDMGGIAKGYAADEALKTLRRAGIEQALVALGGDIAVSNPPPGKKGWSIEIASLNLADAPKPPPLLLHNAAVSTSGDAEQFVEIGGIRYSHIIDPRTGKALTGRRSVTVVAAHGIDSDALATAVSVLDPQEGLKLIDAKRSAAALFVVQTTSGIRTWKSKRWKG
jgi:thiamine biosynthesis lipoprotein